MRSALGQGASGNGTDGPANEVWGHVCKAMIELNMERCRWVAHAVRDAGNVSRV